MYRKQCLINNGSLKSFVCSELDINDFKNRSFLIVVSLEKLFTQFYCRTTYSNFQNLTLLYKPRIISIASISFFQMKVSRIPLGVGSMGICLYLSDEGVKSTVGSWEHGHLPFFVR